MADYTARSSVILNGQEAEDQLEKLGKRAKELREEMKKLRQANDLAGFDKKEKELKEVNKEMGQMRKEVFSVEKVLKNLSGASFKEISTAARKATNEFKAMKQTDPGYKEKAAQVQLLNVKMRELSGTTRAQQSLLSRSAAGFNKYFTLITAGIATFTGILFSVKEFVKGMVGLDDSLANVMKTTGMARTEVREMYGDFKTFNTRTPRKELLLLAEEAGRLGKRSRQDVMDFVEVANQIKVALGDDLGGEASVAIREVGKLTEIYKIGNQYGTDFKESMLKVGSAINEVSANSNAQAPYLIDYLKRLGGIAGQMKINAADTIGYASTLDQLGQSQEMAATAQGKLMVDMFKDQAKYAAIAKMSTKDFADLLNTDANEAFLKLLDGLNGNNDGFSVMAEKLDGMGVDGARAVQVLAVLSANTKIVREQQALANDAMDKGISLTNEYNIKNNNLAGSVEKIGQFLHSKLINSSFLGWMEKVVAKVSEWTEVKLYDTLRKEQTELNLLVNSIANANNTNETRKALLDELQKKYPDFLKNLDTEKLTNEQLAARLKEVNTEYENKILLAIKEDSLTDNYKQRLQLKLDELKAIKDLAYYEQIANKAREKVPQGAEANTYRAVLTTEEIQALQNVELIPKKLQGIRNQFAELQNEESELNAAISGLQSKVTNLNSGSPAPNHVGTPDGSFGESGTSVSGGSPANLSAQEAIELAKNKEMLALKEQYAGKESMQKFYQARLLANELAYLQAKLNLETDEGKQVELQSQIIDKQLEYNKAIQDAVDPLRLKKQAVDEINTSLLEEAKLTQRNAGIAAQAASDQEALNEKLTAQANLYSDTINVISDSLYELMSGSEDAFKTFAKNILIFALEQLKVQAQIAAAGATVQSLASPESIATFGVAGLAKAALIVGLIEAAFAGVEGLVNNAFSSKSGKNYFDGGHTGAGDKYEPAGIVHKGEYVIPQEGTQNPQLRPIIDVMEIARRNGSLARLDLRQIVQAIPVKGMATGGYSSSSYSPPSQGGDSPDFNRDRGGSDQILVEKLDELADTISKLKIYASIEDIRKADKNYTEIQNTRGL